MYTVWHVDKYNIIFKLITNWTNEILQHIVVSSGLSRSSIIDARAWYWALARRLRNTALEYSYQTALIVYKLTGLCVGGKIYEFLCIIYEFPSTKNHAMAYVSDW